MFILIVFLVLYGCVNAKYYEVKHSRSQNSILRNVFPNSGIDMKSLNQLAKVFPNHTIEIQIQGTQDELPGIKNRPMKHHNLRGPRHFYQKWPYRIGRSGETAHLDKALLANAGQKLPTTTTTPTTITTMTTKQENMPTTKDLFPHQPIDGQKRPLYIEDLKQALEDFEKKLATKVDHDDYNCISDHESGSNEQLALPHIDNRNMAVKNFHDVVKLIEKGVKVQLEVTTPRHQDSKLKWVPIKVPRGMYNL